MFINAALESIK